MAEPAADNPEVNARLREPRPRGVPQNIRYDIRSQPGSDPRRFECRLDTRDLMTAIGQHVWRGRPRVRPQQEPAQPTWYRDDRASLAGLFSARRVEVDPVPREVDLRPLQ